MENISDKVKTYGGKLHENIIQSLGSNYLGDSEDLIELDELGLHCEIEEFYRDQPPYTAISDALFLSAFCRINPTPEIE